MPTVTDANLVLGYLGAGAALAGDVVLDGEAAERAVDSLGRRLGLDRAATAWGIARVVDHEMAQALRVVTVERGVDPRAYALVCFGGAGPMHAARLAEELEIERVICPSGAGVLSAVGLVVSGARRDFVRSVLLAEPAVATGEGADAAAELADRARAELPGARVEASYDLRYRGQAHELTVPAPLDASAASLRAGFDAAHQERYGYADDQAEIELVNVRVAAIADAPELALGTGGERAPVEEHARVARFGDDVLEAAVVRGELAAGARFDGPAILELPETTVVVPPGWQAVSDENGVVLERAG